MNLKKYLNQPLFVLSIIFIVTMLASSFIYSIYYAEALPDSPRWTFDEDGNFAQAPFPPSDQHIFGTDKYGEDMLYKVIDGAKYTIGFALFITVIRLMTSIGFSFLLLSLPKAIKNFLVGLFESFFYTPLVVIAYILLSPMLLVYTWSFDSWTKFTFTLFALTFLAIPTVTIFISSEIEQIYKREFVINAKTLGGSKFHIFRKHVLPLLKSRLLILFVQQMINVLMIFAHLGILGMFIGGTVIVTENVDFTGAAILSKVSSSNEWAGLIADTKMYFRTYPWIVFTPVVAFSLTILSLSFIVEGLKTTSQRKVIKNVPKKNSETIEHSVEKEDFTFTSISSSKNIVVKKRKRRLPRLRTVMSLVLTFVVFISVFFIFKGMETKIALKASQPIALDEKKEEPKPMKVATPDLGSFYATEMGNGSAANYHIDLKLDDSGQFTATAQIEVENTSLEEWNEIYFYFIPNAFTLENSEKLKKNSSNNSPIELGSYSSAHIDWVLVNGVKQQFTLDYDQLLVPLNQTLQPNEKTVVEISYMFTVPENGVRFTQDDGNYDLAQWYPMLATYKEGWNIKPYSPILESYHTTHSNYTVTYDIPNNYLLMSSADQDAANGSNVGTLQAKKVKDFFITLRKKEDYITQSINYRDIEVRIISIPEDEKYFNTLLQVAKEALEYYDQHIGPYPYQQLDIVLNTGHVAGMEYSGIVTANRSYLKSRKGIEGLKETVVHEIAHQWFYGMISNDPYHSSWIDEGMTTLATNLFFYDFKQRGDIKTFTYLDEAYGRTNAPFVSSNQPVLKYKKASVFAHIYARPALEYWELFQTYEGVKTAQDFLSKYYQIYAYKEIDTDEFIRFTKAYFNMEDSRFFKRWVEYYNRHRIEAAEKKAKNDMEQYISTFSNQDMERFMQFQHKKSELFYNEQLNWFQQLMLLTSTGSTIKVSLKDITLTSIYEGEALFSFNIDGNIYRMTYQIVKGREQWVINNLSLQSVEGQDFTIYFPKEKKEEAKVYIDLLKHLIPTLNNQFDIEKNNAVIKLFKTSQSISFLTFDGKMNHTLHPLYLVISNKEERVTSSLLHSLLKALIMELSNDQTPKNLQEAIVKYYNFSIVNEKELTFDFSKAKDQIEPMFEQGLTMENVFLGGNDELLLLVDFLVENDLLSKYVTSFNRMDSNLLENEQYESALLSLNKEASFADYLLAFKK